MKTIRYVFITLFCLFAVTHTTHGQTSFSFRHLNVGNGLSSNSVKSILKDSEGFLWVGTDNGLNRYDGYTFKLYQPNKHIPHSILFNDIWNLQEDAEGNLWIASGYQYCIYNREKDNFTTDVTSYLLKMGIAVSKPYRIYIDRRRRLWVLQRQQLFCYDYSRKQLKTYYIHSIPEDNTPVTISDDTQNIYLCWDTSLLVIDNDSQKYNVVDYFPPPLSSVRLNNLYIDHIGGFWLYSDNCDLLFHKKDLSSEWVQVTLQSKVTIGGNAIRCLQDDGNGHLWIGTDHKGMFIYDYANDHLVNLLNDPTSSTSLSSNRIYSISFDDNGVLWVGHFKKGLSYTHSSFNGTINNFNREFGDVAAILEDKTGNIWLGTDGNGLYLKERHRDFAIRKMPIPDVAIVCLKEDHKGRIWVGSYQDGIFIFDHKNVHHYTAENSQLPYNCVWSIEEDRYGKMWIGYVNGTLTCFDPETNEATRYLQPSGNIISVLDFYYDQGDKLYVGTASGLCMMDITTRKSEMIYSNRKGTQRFCQNYISSVYKDNRDILWLAHKQGLTAWHLTTDTLYYFDTSNGICDNLVKSIVQDKHQNMWFSTNNGLSVLTVQQNRNETPRFTFQNLTTKDGLAENSFNSHSACILASGDLLFGGTSGYTCLNPNKLTEKQQPLAKVYFTKLTIGNEIIEVDSIYKGRKLLTKVLRNTSTLSLKHDDNLVTIEFAAGDLLNADKTKYAYKLDGITTQWYYTTENKIVLNTIPSGTHTLMVKACNSDGIWNQHPTTLQITVAPPPYLSHTAKTIYLLLVVTITVILISWLKKRQKTRQAQQQLKMQQEQKLLLNEMKLKFFTNISHDLRTPLTLIISPLQMLLNENKDEATRKKLNTVYKNAQQLLALINSLLDFRKLDVGQETLKYKAGDMVMFLREVCNTFQEYALEHDICFRFMSEVSTLNMSFDPGKIKKVMSNLLSNAFKFTSDHGEINVLLYCEEEQLRICVADNGVGIADKDKEYIFERFYQASNTSEKTGSGIGLHIANEYIHLHHGTISVSDNIPQGAVFTVTLPIVINADEKEKANTALNPETLPADGSQETLSRQQQYTVLLVDDNKDFCHFMAEYLADEYNVLTAYNGAEALEVLEKKEVNITISDIMMPVMNGIELCRQIKTNLQWSHIPVILLTARMAEECKNEGYEQGADDYIIKPFDFNLLKMRIRKFIEWTEKSHQAFKQKMEVTPSEITITSLDEQLISKAIRIVEDNLADSDFSVEKLGEELGLSRSYLYKKLMLITGKGPAEFIRIIRLKRSKQLLEKSQKQIAEIAYEVGFNSPKRFTISFKKEFGILPSDYIRSLK